MKLESLESLVNRVFFGAAFILLAVSVLEKVANVAGYTVIGASYSPGRLFEFAAVLLLFVITLLLRDIREQRKSGS